VTRYAILLTPDAEMGGFTVTVPALPGCVTEGDTFEDALTNAREAIAGHVAALQNTGQPLPAEEPPPVVAFVDVPDTQTIVDEEAVEATP
jgi:antitoxin HicB